MFLLIFSITNYYPRFNTSVTSTRQKVSVDFVQYFTSRSCLQKAYVCLVFILHIDFQAQCQLFFYAYNRPNQLQKPYQYGLFSFRIIIIFSFQSFHLRNFLFIFSLFIKRFKKKREKFFHSLYSFQLKCFFSVWV